MDVFRAVIPANFTREDHREGVRLISKMMSRTGVTSVTDASGSPEDLFAYQQARDAGELFVRIYCHIFHAFVGKMLEAGVKTGLGDEWVRVGAQKMVCDVLYPSAPPVFRNPISVARMILAFSSRRKTNSMRWRAKPMPQDGTRHPR